jgi:hypothetical protein
MPKLIIKQFILVTLIILAVLSIVFGSILPLMKAQGYISALTDLQSAKIHSVDQFKTEFGAVLDFYSPIGQEEIVKFLSESIMEMMINETQQTGKLGPVAPALVSFVEPYLFTNNVRHLLFAAEAYRTLWQATGNKDYFVKSYDYYQKAYAIGPKLPPVLYGMLDLYGLVGDRVDGKKIGEIILQYWPDDQGVANAIKSL